MKALDSDGISALWAKAKATFAPKSHTHGAATKSAAGFMSAADKEKLDGLSDSGGGGDFLADEDFVAYVTN